MNQSLIHCAGKRLVDSIAAQRAKTYDLSKTVCIFASGRGGSTWLAELFSQSLGSYLLWEPLHWRANPDCVEHGFGKSIYIPVSADEAEKLAYIRSIVRGEQIAAITNRNVFFSKANFVFFKRYVVKFVNGNMLLPWMSRRLATQNVYMLRHPCAVVASERDKDRWEGYKKEFAVDERLFDEYSHIAKVYSRVESLNEVLAFKWAVDNFVPLQHGVKGRWISFTYEDLVLAGEDGVRAIMETVGLDPTNAMKRVRQPSATSVQTDYSAPRDRLESWRKKLNEDEAAKIIRVARDVGVDIYDVSPEPKTPNYFFGFGKTSGSLKKPMTGAALT